VTSVPKQLRQRANDKWQRIVATTFGQSSTTANTEDLTDRLRRRAYELWEQEGRPSGEAQSHWLRAEAEHHAATDLQMKEIEKHIKEAELALARKRRNNPFNWSLFVPLIGVIFASFIGYIQLSPYPASAGCATAAGSRRTRLAPPGRVPVLS
jgi:hypothetical protein